MENPSGVDEKLLLGKDPVSMDHVQVVIVVVEEPITFPTLAVSTVLITWPTRQPIRCTM